MDEVRDERVPISVFRVLRIVDQKITGIETLIWGGEIQAVNAFFRIMPLETPCFWPSAR